MKRTALLRKQPLSHTETADAKECAYQPCKKLFIPLKMGQKVCGPLCAGRKARADRLAEKAQDRAKRQAMKGLPELKAEAQREFNKWIRARDHDRPCISCGARPPDLSGLHAGRDAGHYRSVGAAAHLRFTEDNCHAQCVHCNQWKSGKAVEYRIGLTVRIGAERVEALERDNEPRKWTREELVAIRDTYRAKLKALKKERE